MGQINRETIQRIVDENDIVEVIGSYFPVKRAGSNYRALCPFHNEKSPSFNINPQRQIFHCFGCGEGGDVIRFVMKYENLAFPDAAKKLAERVGIRVEEEVYDAKEEASRKLRRELQALHKKAAEWFHRLLLKKDFAQPARDYLKGRGIGIEVARRWQFGYAPENARLLIDWAQSEGFTVRHLVEGGLAAWREDGRPDRGAYARFRHRLMFPVANDFGDPIAFSGRVLAPDQPGGKYVNSPETPLFNKSKTLFGFDKSKRAILKAGRAIVCEGQLDMIAAFESGIENIVAPLGTAFTEQHARILKRHTDEVVLCYDSDTAGHNAVIKAFRLLAAAGVLVRVAELPAGEDPDSLIRGRGAEAFRALIENAPEFFDYQIDLHGSRRDLSELRERLNFARELAANIALIEEKMLQDSLIHRVIVKLGVGEEDIRKLVRDARRTNQRAEASARRRESADRNREASREAANGADSAGTQQGMAADLTLSNRTVRLLCQLLLGNAGFRAEVTHEPPPDYLRDIPGTELLGRIWRGSIDPDSPASVSSFIATLSSPEQSRVTALLNEPMPPLPGDVAGFATECLQSLYRQSLQSRSREIRARLKTAGMSTAQVEQLNKELLDLTKRLNDIPKPSIATDSGQV
ncbi:MAG: DNA primase [Verrucomicrobiae bacterium]|nr:DNA primase [Verrucomicrobiae bacterium]MCP5541442.1 DNA primase [Akkermansiaceae bacterium]MCP5551574.1 DNA primase [Akkermansiaceae bacterium]